ncbi:DUF294 nucleotidyltransferase-like domain-containing protein [Heyndrickxia sp. MSNUG]|uniref:DUF294 nucleotidyltransferase-like domain-containing protein n=1 Tax=Heyndrickxia sp. MSNUG TaxID=3136677 RepID=UPI003C2F7631
MEFTSYEQINDFRLQGIALASRNNHELNDFHDQVYELVISLALRRMNISYGDPPSSFTFFVMGSAGRFEQSIWSDQDHGIVFETNNDESKKYFIHLGHEISDGLERAGYPKCSGGVMAGNPLWCKPMTEWKAQIHKWTAESSWESIRYLLIFADSRPLYGTTSLLMSIKKEYSSSIEKEHLIRRMLQNTMHIKKGVGVLGQLLVETHGNFSGSINLKDTAFFPYVNAARLLALNEKITETSTLSRLTLVSQNAMPSDKSIFFAKNFSRLLEFRLLYGNHHNYESGHYVNGDNLTKSERKELKALLKSGELLYYNVKGQIEKENQYGNE